MNRLDLANLIIEAEAKGLDIEFRELLADEGWIKQSESNNNFCLEDYEYRLKPNAVTCYMYKDNSCPDKVYVSSRYRANCSIIDTWEREIPS
jgi:hypothetical protein